VLPPTPAVPSETGSETDSGIHLFLSLVTVGAGASEPATSKPITSVTESILVTPTSPVLTTTLPLTGTVVVTTTASAAQPSSADGNVLTTQIYLPWVAGSSQ